MKKFLPLLLALVGLGAGIGAGIFLRPAPPEPEASAAATPAAPDLTNAEYVKLSNQFVVPDILDEQVVALVVLSLTLEVGAGGRETVFQREPKLRDAIIQVLFAHANAGGFRGTFTESGNMTVLRNALREAAQSTLGDLVYDVLIVDIVRQDMRPS
ncbi:MAG: flagellar basal body-associated FliL family protein [Paracoccaceae bacterium]